MAEGDIPRPRECGECGRNGEDFATCPRSDCPAKPRCGANWRERAIVAESVIRDASERLNRLEADRERLRQALRIIAEGRFNSFRAMELAREALNHG